MAIYTRNKEGKLKALPIKAIKGENGIDGIDGVTPNIKIGEVTTLEAGEKAKVEIVGERENPVINFSIPKGKDGDADGCEIKDGEISEEDTWSSDKITKWSMEQDGVHWVEKEDNFISVDNTYEYKLKEVEIFGDTWQDKDSKNLFDINSMVGAIAEKGIIDVEKNSITFNYENVRNCGCETNFIFESSKKYKISADVEYNNPNINTRLICIGPVGLGFEYRDNLLKLIANKTNFSERRFAVSTVIPNDGNQYALYLNGTSHQNNVTGNTIFKNIVIEEVDDKTDTTKPTEYIPYHKADLSNIQHAGELYVDKDGEPKLDEQGRKQYKIEIESCNGNLFTDEFYMLLTSDKSGIYSLDDKYVIQNKSDVRSWGAIINPLPIYQLKPNTKYKLSNSIGSNVETRSDDNQNIGGSQFTTTNTGKIKLKFNSKYNQKFKVCLQTGSFLNNPPYDRESHKQTIILPCQLSRVGNIKDRLFWDENKGKCKVEKNILKVTIDGSLPIGKYNESQLANITEGYTACYVYWRDTSLKTSLSGQTKVLGNKKNYVGLMANSSGGTLTSEGYAFINPYIQIYIKKSNLKDNSDTIENIREYLNKKPLEIYLYNSELCPQLIETNITKPLYLPTYNNKTHAYITNTNNAKATIKAKFPIKTSNTLSTLSLESNKASNDILNLQDINVELVSNNFEMDFRVSEIEWNLEDRGLLTLHELLTNENISNNKINLTRYEQAKILIISNKYNKDKMTYQLSKYLERKYIKQEEFDELIELMK